MKAPLFPIGRFDYQTLQHRLNLLQHSACSAGAMDPLREIALLASVLRPAGLRKPEYEPPNQDNIDDQPAYDREVVLRAHAVVVSRSQASRSFSRAFPPSPTSAEGIRPDSRDQGRCVPDDGPQ